MERREAPEPAGGLSDPDASRPLCSIVIPSYNGRELLARCLASIDRHRPDPSRLSTEIVVVDNGSSDGTFEWLQRARPDVRAVRIHPNRDFTGAANAGLEAAHGVFVQLLNNDTEVTAGWIEAGLATIR